MVFVKEQQNSPPSPPLLKPRHSSVLHVAQGGGLASKSMTSDYVIHFCVDEITADGLDLGFSVQILLPLHYVLEKLCCYAVGYEYAAIFSAASSKTTGDCSLRRAV